MSRIDAVGKLKRIAALVEATDRKALVQQLAPLYRADDLAVFLKDRQVNLFLPIPGLSQRLRNGRAWQSFLARCDQDGRAQDRLQWAGNEQPVTVMAVRSSANAILVLVGDSAHIEDDDELLIMLPMLAWAFDKENQARASAANAALALEKETSAHLLAEALDKARAKLAAALVEAQRAHAALHLADQRKDEFLAILAHELRNPLAPLGNGIELLKFAEDNPGLLPDIRRMMDNQLRQMVRLIDDLMDVSRITRGKVTLKFQRVPLMQIIDAAIEGARPTIDRLQHTLNVSASDENIILNADAARLAQVFSNLLTNAAKYTDPGGRIDLSVSGTPTEVVITVKDSGVGLDAGEVDNIFDMFVQVNRSSEDARGGLGIGLTLVKRLVELHRGTVIAKSEGRGAGSEFIVTLPKATLRQAPSPKQSPSPANDLHCEPLSLLIVDDNEASASTMSTIAELLGHEPDIAFTGRDALAKARLRPPNILLLDIGLPDISGYEVCRRLRQEPAFDRTLIVAQTGWGQERHKQRGREAGFDYYLVKPLNMEHLQKIIGLAQRGDKPEGVRRKTEDGKCET